MTVLQSMPWLAILVPLLLATLLATGVRIAGNAAPWVALAGPVTMAMTGAASLEYGASGAFRWLSAGSASLYLGFHVDGLAAVMLLVVGTVAACVIVFSVGYMRGDRGYVRYFAILSLFTAAMGGLVIASDLVGLFIAWEMVGACSYLLIGFWYERPAAADAARKAFLVTRVGDAAIMLAMAVLWRATGTLDLASVLSGGVPRQVAAVAAMCLLAGAVGKSAQFPLHIWLPDAMEGPTPVSALIHAATMVAAGVFLIARTWPLFAVAPDARMMALVLGALTALGAATVALVQTDIKKVLAYSTISQLGFMFAAIGVGAWPVAVFHLVTHAAFKALLFLASGSVIHGTGTQDIREMGGLRSSMPITATAWSIGGLALAGVPPMAGFFSKDEVVSSVLRDAPWAGVMLLVASILTGAYVARVTRSAFFDGRRTAGPAHEAPWSMTAPLGVLSLLSVVLGAFSHRIAEVLGVTAEPLATGVAIVAVALAMAGAAAGWVSAAPGRSRRPATLAARWSEAARSGYGLDALASRMAVEPLTRAAAAIDALIDRTTVDGAVEGVGRLARWAGARLSASMTGDGQSYAIRLALGVASVTALTIWMVR